MLAAEVNVERDKLPDEMRFRGAFPQIFYRIHGGGVVRSGSMQGDAQRRHPSFEQGDEIVEERVVRVRGIRNSFEAPQSALTRPDVVLEHPEVAPLHRLWQIFSIVALNQCPGRRCTIR